MTGNTFNADNAMTAFGGQTLTYDANGNLTNDGTNTYASDARNHLAAIAGGVTASFQYDAVGRRLSKTIDGVITQFLYDGQNPIQEMDGSSPPNVTASLLSGLRVDERFTRTDSSGTANFLTDSLGSTLALADSSGVVQTRYGYAPFGNVTVDGAPSVNAYQLTGRDNDGTGLY